MKRLLLKLVSASLLSLLVNSCAQDNTDFEDYKPQMKLIENKDLGKKELINDQKQSDSVRIEKFKQTAEATIIETVDPDKIKPPQH